MDSHDIIFVTCRGSLGGLGGGVGLGAGRAWRFFRGDTW